MEPERWTAHGGYERGYERRVAEAPRFEERRFYGDGNRDRDRWEHERWERERRHDRDGDGVPNRYDRSPDNPYRR
jgi:hypothetical protein